MNIKVIRVGRKGYFRKSDITFRNSASVVIAGLDLAIHPLRKKDLLRSVMDARVKPGHDEDGRRDTPLTLPKPCRDSPMNCDRSNTTECQFEYISRGRVAPGFIGFNSGAWFRKLGIGSLKA